ncbi:MAG: type II secretion system protein [Proteobacteria bacterium]|nr:type II secretion system protein [Pseudomonadota bacterium]
MPIMAYIRFFSWCYEREMRIVNNLKKSKQDGFTLIELLMVILVIAILAVIGITQFVNYGKDSRDAATKSNLQILRRAIAEKNGMIRLRCNVQDSRFPLTASINANNILTPTYTSATSLVDSPCQAGDVPVAADQLFVTAGIPVNPWSDDIHSVPNHSNTVYTTVASRPQPGDPWATCTAGANDDHGWCYNPTTGEIWANSAANDGNGIAHTGNEHTF